MKLEPHVLLLIAGEQQELIILLLRLFLTHTRFTRDFSLLFLSSFFFLFAVIVGFVVCVSIVAGVLLCWKMRNTNNQSISDEYQ